MQFVARELVDALRDRVAVQRSRAEYAQDEHDERAGRKASFPRHSVTMSFSPVARHGVKHRRITRLSQRAIASCRARYNSRNDRQPISRVRVVAGGERRGAVRTADVRIFIFDAHVGTPRYTVDEGYRWDEEHPYYETDIPRLKRGKAGAILFGVYVEPQDWAPSLWVPRTLEQIDAFHQEARRNAKDVEVAYTSDDVTRIHKSGKIAALVSLEGGHLIQDSLRLLRVYHQLGVKYMTLATSGRTIGRIRRRTSR